MSRRTTGDPYLDNVYQSLVEDQAKILLIRLNTGLIERIEQIDSNKDFIDFESAFKQAYGLYEERSICASWSYEKCVRSFKRIVGAYMVNGGYSYFEWDGNHLKM